MTNNDLAEKIVRIPFEVRTNPDTVNFKDLLKSFGYYSDYRVIKVPQLIAALKSHIGMIEEWLLWSQNKRVSTGWYFVSEDDGEYVVGYYPPEGDSPPLRYSDASTACANYIMLEIEDLRLSKN